MGNAQDPKNQCGQQSNHQKELLRVLTCDHSCDYRVFRSDTSEINWQSHWAHVYSRCDHTGVFVG